MIESQKLITDFYIAFQKKDWRGMQACYHDKIEFSDPVFRDLKGGEAKAMWHMLAEAAKDLIVVFKNVDGETRKGSCDWDALYSFSRTGRKVHNIIHAEFEFKDGKIIKHTDTFDLWRWAGMALGPSGKLLGWAPFLQGKVRATARKSLDKFIAEHPEYRS
ncbi:nuclear transport factor 2 family protein [soil metagenome]